MLTVCFLADQLAINVRVGDEQAIWLAENRGSRC